MRTAVQQDRIRCERAVLIELDLELDEQPVSLAGAGGDRPAALDFLPHGIENGGCEPLIRTARIEAATFGRAGLGLALAGAGGLAIDLVEKRRYLREIELGLF